MSDDPTDEDDRTLGAAAQESDNLISLLGHFYRGQLDRETTWRTRLDRTTNWAVLVIATLLTWSFSQPDNPHYILLIGALLVCLFLALESHRYLAYDVSRSRVRMVEEDLFTQAFDPGSDVEHEDWRHLLAEDLRRPAAKITPRVAVSRRLRRVYLPLLSILLAAWVVKLALFQPGRDVLSAAALPPVPGIAVFALVGAFYLLAVAVAVWPDEAGRREVETASPGSWDRGDDR